MRLLPFLIGSAFAIENSLYQDLTVPATHQEILSGAQSLSRKLEFPNPVEIGSEIKLQVPESSPFNGFIVDIQTDTTASGTQLTASFYRERLNGTLRPKEAKYMEFYMQFLRQELDPAWLANREDLLFKPKSEITAYSLAFTFPEALPLYLKSGDFAERYPENFIMGTGLFVLGDIAATYMLFSQNKMPGQRIIGISGYGLTRLLGWAYARYSLKRNKILVKSGYKFER